MKSKISKYMQGFQISYYYFGIYGTAAVILNKALQTLNVNVHNEWYKRVTDRAFDNRFGVDTGGIIQADQLDIGDKHRKLAIQYQGTPTLNLGLALSKLPVKHSDFIFIDIGSGKGRALFMAALFPFKEAIGVELSENLHEICEKNISSLKKQKVRCRNIKSVCQDAGSFVFPDEPLVIYFFQPFKEPVFKAVLDNLDLSLKVKSRKTFILYYHPGFNNMMGEPEFLNKAHFGIDDPSWDFYETHPG